jgi:cell division protein FtsL
MVGSFLITDPALMAIAIAVVSGVVIVVVLVLVWLACAYLKLKRDHQALTEIVHSHNHRHNNDIRDLNATSLTVAGWIADTDEKISGLSTKISDYHQNEPSTHPYGSAIQKVRSGASVSELMQGSGLSQDEAALLIRLHGSKAQS